MLIETFWAITRAIINQLELIWKPKPGQTKSCATTIGCFTTIKISPQNTNREEYIPIHKRRLYLILWKSPEDTDKDEYIFMYKRGL